MGGFPKKNITAERTYNPKTLYSNFILLNNAQLGLGRPALTFPEACQAVKWPNGRDPRASQKLREYACLGSQAYQEHQKVKKKQPKIQRIKSKIMRSVEGCFGEEINSKTDNLDVFERYVRDFMQEVEEKNLFGVANKPEPNLSSGYEVFGREISTILAQATRKFVKNQGVLPNLLFPQTFSEFNILCKAFYRFPVGPLEDKLRAIELVPDDALKLLSKHFRPFVVDAAGAPINAQIPPGAYLWKANFGYSLYEMVSFPATKERCLELEALAGEWFKSSTNIATGQWWTRHVQRKVFLEERLGTSDEEPRDWKFFVFGGRVGLVQVDSGRHSDHHQSAFDREFNRLNVEIYATDGPDIQRPERYEEMLFIAETIGSRFDFIRVDLYFEGGKIYLGELTPVTHAGFKPFRTQSLDFKLGKMWPKDSVLRNDLDWYYRSSRDRSQC